MIKTLLIDDEPLARNLLREYLSFHPNFEILAECENGFEGLKAIQTHKPDLIFLDIQMPKLDGFELLELCEQPLPAIIFTTAFDEYAIKAFETNTIDYLLKPIGKDRFDKAILRFRQFGAGNTSDLDLSVFKKTPETRIVVKHNGEIILIPCRDIEYLEAYDDYIKIYIGQQCFVKKQTMSYYVNNLDSSKFCRIHRSYIIQIAQLEKLEQDGKESWKAVMLSGIKLPVSRSGISEIKERIGY